MAVIVAGPLIVAVHVHGNATVGVIEEPESLSAAVYDGPIAATGGGGSS